MILEQIEQNAEQVLKKLNIKSLPVPVEDIANKFQLRISRAPSSDFSGMLIRKDGHALIGINSNESRARQRFTIGHELGHFFLHPNKDAFVDIDYRKSKNETPRTPREREADMFAAALLMPRFLLLQDIKLKQKGGVSEEDIAELAAKYDVSDDAMRYRIINLTAASV